MKKLSVLVFLIIITIFLPVRADGLSEQMTDSEIIDRILSSGELSDVKDKVPDSAKDDLESIGLSELSAERVLSLGTDRIIELFWDIVLRGSKKPFIAAGAVIGILLLVSLLEGLKLSFAEKILGGIYGTVATLAASVTLLLPVVDYITRAGKLVQDASIFMLGFAPVMASVTAASAQPVTASAYSMAVYAAAEIIMQIVISTILPVVYIILAVSVVGSISQAVDISSVLKVAQNTVNIALCFFLTVFVGMLTIKGVVGNATDTLSVKTGKFVVGSFVPVVGGALSEAVVSVASCVKVIKSVVGVFGIVVGILTVAPVIAEGLIWLLVTSFCAAIGEMLGIVQLPKLLRSINVSIGIMIAVVFTTSLLFTVSTTIILLLTSG